ncbi:MAG: ComEC family competence protein [Bacteroidia bacterium]|nr:ComEC family competence protein [Bacteroidia bacterium]
MGALSSIPFLRPTLALALGLSTGLYSHLEQVEVAFWMIPIAAIAAFCSLCFFNLKWKRVSGFMLMLAFVCVGITLSVYSQKIYAKSFFSNSGKWSHLKLRLTDELNSKANSWRCLAEVLTATDSAGMEYQCSGNVIVYWPMRSNAGIPAVKYGDEIWVENRVLPMPSAAFPEDFDFKAVMRYKNVQHQLFLPAGSWKKTGSSPNWLFGFSYACKAAIISKLKRDYNPETATLLASLLLGQRAEMDPETLKEFSATGTMHILAVSGMHVGLIYMLLVLLFTFKKQAQKLAWYQAVLVLLFLWAFALVTGLSASVVRATIMFSIVEIGRSLLYRRGNLLNSLFAAAFFQLLFDPLSLIDAGFQLSYLAVLGIAIIYPMCILWYVPKTKFLFLVYQLGIMSISATIATLPATLYYFQSFPIWFIPANILAVPLSTLTIYLVIAALLLSWVPLLGKILILAVTFSDQLLMYSVHVFGSLPSASITGIFLDDIEALILVLIMLFALMYLHSFHRKWLFLTVGVCCLNLGYIIVKNHKQGVAKRIIMCELKGEMLAVLHHNRQLKVISAPISQGKADSLFKYFGKYCTKYQIKKVEWSMMNKPYIAVAEILGEQRIQSKNNDLVVMQSWVGDLPKIDHTVFVRERDAKYWEGQVPHVHSIRNTFFIMEL